MLISSEFSARVQFCKLDTHFLSLFTIRKSVARIQFRGYRPLLLYIIIDLTRGGTLLVRIQTLALPLFSFFCLFIELSIEIKF